MGAESVTKAMMRLMSALGRELPFLAVTGPTDCIIF